MRAAWVLAMACVLVLVGCGGPAADRERMLRIGYSVGSVERYEYRSSVSGVERSASGGAAAQDQSEVSADAAWRGGAGGGGGAPIEESLGEARPAPRAGLARVPIPPDRVRFASASAAGPAPPGRAPV